MTDLILPQREILTDLLGEMKNGDPDTRDFPSQAGALFVSNGAGLEKFGSYGKNGAGSDIALPGDSFLSRIDAGHENPYHVHTPNEIRDIPPNGLDELLQGLGLAGNPVTGVFDFMLRTSTTDKHSPVVIGTMVNPVESVMIGTPRKLSKQDRGRLGALVDKYQRKLDYVAGIQAETTVSTLEGLFGTKEGIAENPVLPGFESVSYIKQQAGRFGGDYLYGTLNGDRTEASYGNGDVAGHDIDALKLSYTLKASLTAMLLDPHPPNGILDRLNKLIIEQRMSESGARFSVFTLAKFNEGGDFTFSGAGYKSYIIRGDGSHEVIDATGLPLGITEGMPYGVTEHELKPGDTYVSCSDGYLEAGIGSDMFGQDRTIAALNARKDLRGKIEYLNEQVHADSTGKPVDDDLSITIVRKL